MAKKPEQVEEAATTEQAADATTEQVEEAATTEQAADATTEGKVVEDEPAAIDPSHGSHNSAVNGLQTDASGGYDRSKL
jgi:hypothetical protein